MYDFTEAKLFVWSSDVSHGQEKESSELTFGKIFCFAAHTKKSLVENGLRGGSMD